MKKWEYMIIHTRAMQEAIFKGESPHKCLLSYFNELGGEGWEIVNFGQTLNENGIFVYPDCLAKREKMPDFSGKRKIKD